MKYLILLATIILGTMACASKKKMTSSDPSAESSVTEVLSLSKTACFGECPEFTLTIYSNGRAVLDGKRFVKQIGLSEMMITSEEMESLMKTCDDAKLFAMNDEYNERVMDLPTTTLSYKHDGKSKKITGNMGFPESFRTVVQACMQLLDDSRWKLKQAYNTK